MTANLTQASNNTGLAVTRELSPGVVDGTAVWNAQEPNSYKNFGAAYKQVARQPINASRQNRKGVITDLDSMGGWQEDVTYNGTKGKIEGLMYADFRNKAELATTGAIASSSEFTVAAGGAVFAAGDLVFTSGYANPANNGLFVVTAGSAGYITVAGTLVDETAVGKIVKVGHQCASGDLTYTASTKTMASTALDFTTLGLMVGEWLFAADDDAAKSLISNLGYARIKSVAPHAIVFDRTMPADPTLPIIDGPGTGETARFYFGRIVKNELGPLIKHYTYQLERTLGRDDTTASTDQAEYLVGGVFSEAVFTFNSADKVTAEWSTMAAKYETRTSSVGPKPGTRPPLSLSSAFNTSTDVKFMSIELAGTDTPLYAYLMNLAITVNNNVKASKAIGVLGSIGMNEGQFVVSAAATAYFANVTAAQAIENNQSCNLSACIARDNQGILFDIPLITLGDGAPKVTANERIQLPLTIDAASAASLNPATDYTLLLTFFDYLPTIGS